MKKVASSGISVSNFSFILFDRNELIRSYLKVTIFDLDDACVENSSSEKCSPDRLPFTSKFSVSFDLIYTV